MSDIPSDIIGIPNIDDYASLIGDPQLETLFSGAVGSEENEVVAFGDALLAAGHPDPASVMDAMIHACSSALEWFDDHKTTTYEEWGEHDKAWFEKKKAEVEQKRRATVGTGKFAAFFGAYHRDMDAEAEKFISD